jgi:hypothetical protein
MILSARAKKKKRHFCCQESDRQKEGILGISPSTPNTLVHKYATGQNHVDNRQTTRPKQKSLMQ